MNADTETLPVNATRMSFDVIEALRTLDGAGVSALADHLGIPKSTAHDHLRTLEELELIVNDGGEYRAGIRFLDLGGYARQGRKIYKVAKPELDKLAQATGEHCNLMVTEHGMGVFLYKAEGPDAVQLDTYIGYRVPLQTTALGKTILANLPAERVEAILDRHGLPEVTERTITDRKELLAELDQVREDGYATDIEERVRGMHCVAVPVVRDEEVLGAVSISGPKSRMQGKRFEEDLPDQLHRVANVIEVNMTYS